MSYDRNAEIEELRDYWRSLGRQHLPSYQSVYNWLNWFSADEIRSAMQIAVSQTRGSYVKYLAGIMRAWRKERIAGRPLVKDAR